MNLKFSDHAQTQMARRGIKESEVEQAHATRETTYSSYQPGIRPRLVILGSTEEGRRLKIVVLADDHRYVITVADRDQEG